MQTVPKTELLSPVARRAAILTINEIIKVSRKKDSFVTGEINPEAWFNPSDDLYEYGHLFFENINMRNPDALVLLAQQRKFVIALQFWLLDSLLTFIAIHVYNPTVARFSEVSKYHISKELHPSGSENVILYHIDVYPAEGMRNLLLRLLGTGEFDLNPHSRLIQTYVDSRTQYPSGVSELMSKILPRAIEAIQKGKATRISLTYNVNAGMLIEHNDGE